MTTINLSEAKARLSHYAHLVKKGETVILCDRNKPFAEIRPYSVEEKPVRKRKLGQLKGRMPTQEEWDQGNAEIEESFLKGSIFPEKGRADNDQ